MYRLSQQQHGVLPNKLLPTSTFSSSERRAADSPTAEPVPAWLWIVFQPSSCSAISSQALGKWEGKPREHLDRWEQLSGDVECWQQRQTARGWFLQPPCSQIYPIHKHCSSPYQPRFENHHIYSVWRRKYYETKTSFSYQIFYMWLSVSSVSPVGYSHCRRWETSRAAVLSLQVSLSSARSLLICNANRYLEERYKGWSYTHHPGTWKDNRKLSRRL